MAPLRLAGFLIGVSPYLGISALLQYIWHGWVSDRGEASPYLAIIGPICNWLAMLMVDMGGRDLNGDNWQGIDKTLEVT